MKGILTTAAALVLTAGFAQAASVDLSSWIENGHRGNNGAGTWTLQGSDNDSVAQTRNGAPTVFFDPGSNAQGTQLSGTIEVLTTSDDDFIGFVLGYQEDEFDSANADFWLIDWKQNNQGAASAGLSLSHVTGDQSVSAENDFWAHVNTVNEVERATNLGSTGWNDRQEYTFDLTFTDSLIEVYVDGVLEISYAGSFTDGAFGFYNYSQSSVLYAGITEEVLPPAVPLPAGLPLLLAGVGAFGLMRRRNAA